MKHLYVAKRGIKCLNILMDGEIIIFEDTWEQSKFCKREMES